MCPRLYVNNFSMCHALEDEEAFRSSAINLTMYCDALYHSYQSQQQRYAWLYVVNHIIRCLSISLHSTPDRRHFLPHTIITSSNGRLSSSTFSRKISMHVADGQILAPIARVIWVSPVKYSDMSCTWQTYDVSCVVSFNHVLQQVAKDNHTELLTSQ